MEYLNFVLISLALSLSFPQIGFVKWVVGKVNATHQIRLWVYSINEVQNKSQIDFGGSLVPFQGHYHEVAGLTNQFWMRRLIII